MSSRDKSPKRKQSVCEICKYKACQKVSKKRIPATGYHDYEIYGKACTKELCCRCRIVISAIIHGEGDDKLTQCKSCAGSKRACYVCKRTSCQTIREFTTGYESIGDEDGFYCCLHLGTCRTFNDDRFAVYNCEICQEIEDHIDDDPGDPDQKLRFCKNDVFWAESAVLSDIFQDNEVLTFKAVDEAMELHYETERTRKHHPWGIREYVIFEALRDGLLQPVNSD